MRANRKEHNCAMYMPVKMLLAGHCAVVFLIPRQEHVKHSPDQGVRIGCHSLTVLGVIPFTIFGVLTPISGRPTFMEDLNL